jgi:hypothetical protein
MPSILFALSSRLRFILLISRGYLCFFTGAKDFYKFVAKKIHLKKEIFINIGLMGRKWLISHALKNPTISLISFKVWEAT